MFINSAADLRRLLARAPEWVCDTETDGLEVVGPQSRDRAWIVGLLPAGSGTCFYIDCGHPEWDEMRAALEQTRLVGHNLRFDVHAMNARPTVPWLDTMAAQYHLNTAGKKSLDDLFPGSKIATLPELKGSKGAQNQIHLLRHGLNQWDQRLLDYLADDLRRTAELHERFSQLNQYHALDERVEQVVQRMEDRGVRLLHEPLAELRHILEPMVAEQLAALRALGFDGNPGSGDQLVQFQAAKFGYQRTERLWQDDVRTSAFQALLRDPKFRWKVSQRGRLKPSTETKKVLAPLIAKGDPFATALMEHRAYEKKYRDFACKLEEFEQPDGLVHGQIKTLHTVTGRFSHAAPNLGQVPKQNKTPREVELGLALKFRQCFTGQSGYMSGADFGQVEMRVAAALSGDENLLAAFGPGMDFHTATACQVFGATPETLKKEQRFAVKQINFGILNGMKEARLALAIGCDIDEAREFRTAYLARFSGLATWMDEVTKAATRERIVQGIDGSTLVYGAYEWINNAVSMKVQGGAALLMKHALVACEDAGLNPVLSVHDEIVGDIQGKGAEYAEVMREAANSAYPELLGQVDFTADGGHGTNWADI